MDSLHSDLNKEHQVHLSALLKLSAELQIANDKGIIDVDTIEENAVADNNNSNTSDFEGLDVYVPLEQIGRQRLLTHRKKVVLMHHTPEEPKPTSANRKPTSAGRQLISSAAAGISNSNMKIDSQKSELVLKHEKKIGFEFRHGDSILGVVEQFPHKQTSPNTGESNKARYSPLSSNKYLPLPHETNGSHWHGNMSPRINSPNNAPSNQQVMVCIESQCIESPSRPNSTDMPLLGRPGPGQGPGQGRGRGQGREYDEMNNVVSPSPTSILVGTMIGNNEMNENVRPESALSDMVVLEPPITEPLSYPRSQDEDEDDDEDTDADNEDEDENFDEIVETDPVDGRIEGNEFNRGNRLGLGTSNRMGVVGLDITNNGKKKIYSEHTAGPTTIYQSSLTGCTNRFVDLKFCWYLRELALLAL